MSVSMPPDSHKISLKIIEAVKQHPILYVTDVKGVNVKLQDFRNKVWQYISDELGLDSGWVKLRWKNLRDTYCRILKYKNKTEKGVRRKKWIFEDHLNFLKFPFDSDYEPQCVEITEDYIQLINNSNISSEGLLEQLEDRNDEDYSEFLEVLEDANSECLNAVSRVKSVNDSINSTILHSSDEKKLKDKNIDKYAQEIESKYRKIRPKQIIEDVKTNSYSIITTPSLKTETVNVPVAHTTTSGPPIIITGPVLTSNPTKPIKKRRRIKTEDENRETQQNSKKVKNSLELFFASMAQTVKRFPEKIQADIKTDICQIVKEAELKHSNTDAQQNEIQRIPESLPKLVLIPCNMLDKKLNLQMTNRTT